MGRQTGIRGVFVIPWGQTETDWEAAAPLDYLAPGVPWRWSGQPVRLDGPCAIWPLGAALGQDDLRARAGRMVRRLMGPRAVSSGAPALPDRPSAETPLGEHGFLLTDGRNAYCATLLRGGRLVLFVDALPPPETELWVVRVYRPERPRRQRRAAGEVICFTPGTMIATPWGARAVEALRPGNRVLTLDDGPKEILWMGRRRLSEAELRARPDLRPVRIAPGALGGDRPDAALLVSPAHRMLVRGRAAQALFNAPEVLVAARDLLNDRSVTRAHGLGGVDYIHLLFARHQIVWANGVAAESFDPSVADLSEMMPDQRALLRLACEGVPGGLAGYAPPSRRCLGAGEAAILGHETRIEGGGRH